MSRLTTCVLLVAFSSIAAGARILAVYPYPSRSHQMVFRALSSELVKHGHEMVVFTPYLSDDLVLANYTEIDLSILVRNWNNFVNYVDFAKKGPWTFLQAMIDQGEITSDIVLSHPAMQNILASNSTEKFDLILMQPMFYDALYALPVRLNVPMIGVCTSDIIFHHHIQFGNELLTPYGFDIVTGHPFTNLWDRIREAYMNFRGGVEYFHRCLSIQDKVLRKHFGDTMPPIEKLSDRFELLFVNSHPFLAEPRPMVPGIVQIGGCRFMESSKNKTLPQDLKTILDNAKNGFIYFSMGSNVKVKQFSNETMIAILSTFAELPYTIVWKSEIDVKDKPENVVIRNWFPQQEILAHPNILLFILQGGMQSIEEAIDHVVPCLGIPVFGDQYSNIQMLKRRGVAEDLQMFELTKETFKRAILKVILNPSYKENVRKLRDLLRDLPHHPMEHAIWWIEHVIRHKGAKHLRCRSRDMSYFKLLHLDIIAVVFALFVLFVSSLFFGLRFVYRQTRRFVKQYTDKSLKRD